MIKYLKMKIEIRIPSPGESISEVELARWLVDDNSWVEKDQEIAEIESEKATLPLIASESGVLSIIIPAGSVIKVNEVACTIDTSAQKTTPKKQVESPSIISKKGKLINPPTQKEKVEESPKQVIKEEKAKTVKITPLAAARMEEENLSVDDVLKGLKRLTSHEIDLVSKNISQGKSSISKDRSENRR